MDKALNYLSLARKAGKAELGEEPAGAISRIGKAYLVLVASDASDHTWRRAKSYVAGTNQQCIRVPFTKDQLGFCIGRSELAIAALTDAPLALAFVQALGEPEKYAATLEALSVKSAKLKQRQTEAKAHERNKARGSVKKNG